MRLVHTHCSHNALHIPILIDYTLLRAWWCFAITSDRFVRRSLLRITTC